MRQTIYKYPIPVEDRVVIEMPEGASVLSVQMQGLTPCVWVLCNPDAPKRPRALRIYGTGHTLPEDPGRFIGTFQMHGGALVFHLFDPSEV